jgi:ParB family transcriptional regulator, chromosome partitioning protein
MQAVEISVSKLREAPWNPNQMDEAMRQRLIHSLNRYGLVQPLVVRTVEDHYEVLNGNQRLRAIRQIGFTSAPCVIVKLDDREAMLLAETLNSLHGEDDMALKGSLLEDILSRIPQKEVLSLLPETADSLQALASLSEADLAEHLKAWEEARAVRLKHLQLQLTPQQLETVEKAINSVLPMAKVEGFPNPNNRSNAIFLLCKYHLERKVNP